MLLSNGVDKDTFLFESLEQAVLRSNPWKPGIRKDIILFNKVENGEEFLAFKIDKSCTWEAISDSHNCTQNIMGLFYKGIYKASSFWIHI